MTDTLELTRRRATHVLVARPLMQPQAVAVLGVQVVPVVILGLLSLLSIFLIL